MIDVKKYDKMIITGILFMTVLLPAYVLAQQTVAGHVYIDQNRDGKHSSSEKGLAKVGVSNGRQIVLTDSKGRYELLIDDDDIIFVIKPRGYMTPVNENNIPQFYYIHKPAGSPKDLKGLGIKPTGPLPESVDFALYKRPEKNKFSVIYFGDPQPGNIDEVNIMSHDVIEELIGTKQAVFGVSLGDLAAENVSEEYDQSIGMIGLPWYNVIGNHDHYEKDPAASTNDIADDRFQRRYGPATYSFNYGPVHFIMIDNITAVWDENSGNSTYWAEYTQETLEFIKNDLSLVPEKRLVVLMFHIAFPGGNSKDVFALLKDRPNTLSLAGHGHEIIHHFIGKEQGWPNENEHHHIETGAICGIHWLGPTDEYQIPTATMHCGSPNGYVTVHFDGNKYRTTFKAARRDADFQMHIFAPSEIKSSESADTEVMVNVFFGNKKSITEMKIGEDGKWTKMQRQVRQDPYLVSTVPTGHPLGNVEHMWVAKLTANRPLGTFVMYFRSKDMYDQMAYGKRVIRVK